MKHLWSPPNKGSRWGAKPAVLAKAAAREVTYRYPVQDSYVL